MNFLFENDEYSKKETYAKKLVRDLIAKSNLTLLAAAYECWITSSPL